MAVLLGIDLGTSSVKAMLTDTDSPGLAATEGAAYDVVIPAPGLAEQSPEIWYRSLISALGALRAKYPKLFAAVSGVGFSGQMHGLVLTGEDGMALRPAIIWLDQRTGKQLAEIYSAVPFEEMRDVIKNRVAVGFALPSLMWVRENEPAIYAKIKSVMLPKDYIRLRLTGEIASDASDASSSTVFDVEKRDWAWDVIDRLNLRRDIFPQIGEAGDIAGRVTGKAARETGLKEGTPVVFGAGDQPCYSLGIGAITPGVLSTSIGTSGQLAAYSDIVRSDPLLRTHTFCHAIKKGYTIFGATLCAGLSLNWLKNKIIHAESYAKMDEMAAAVAPGAGGLIYLPYLTGERTPHMNPNCRGMFMGLTLGMDDGYLIRAVMEGVVFSLKDCLGLINAMGLDAETVIAAGTGAVSELWLQMQADILNRRVTTCLGAERAAVGACMLAGLGTGVYADADEARRALVRYSDRVYEPNRENQKVYQDSYARYKKAYDDNYAAQ